MNGGSSLNFYKQFVFNNAGIKGSAYFSYPIFYNLCLIDNVTYYFEIITMLESGKFLFTIKKLCFAIVIMITTSGIAFTQPKQDNFLKLYYNQHAHKWTEALPIGNGRLGAMIYGGTAVDTLQLNNITVWTGGPNNNVNPAVKPVIKKLRKLIFAGKYLEAQKLANAKATPKENSGMAYQPVGNLIITFPNQGTASHYTRELNLENADATVHYQAGGVTFTRTTFASIPDQVIVEHLGANKKHNINCNLSMISPQSHEIKTHNDQLYLSGISGNLQNMKGQVHFETIVKPVVSGGIVRVHGKSIEIRHANEVTLYISIGTNFKKYNDLTGNAKEQAMAFLRQTQNKSYLQILERQQKAYQKYFNRVHLNLGVTDSVYNTTNVRVKQFDSDNDPQLATLYFQYGRYLLISSSESGGQPATLQGIWNSQMYPAWDSKYTLNINAEMNYWPAEITNLSAMDDPLIQTTKDLSVTGRQAAREMYGARGWVVHHNTDLWRITGIVDGAFWGLWPDGGAWLCENLWRHYSFSGNKTYLKEIYPILKGASEYFVDELQVEPTHHWLVVCPSISPEHAYLHKDGIGISVTDGATMDNQLVFDLFTHTIWAAKLLHKDPLFADTLKMKRDSLPPMQIGKHAELQEWLKDWFPNDHHRHVSMLYGLFPSDQISPYRTPELAAAAKQSLIYRGDDGTGWSIVWKMNLWARLLDGNHAYKLLQDELRPAFGEELKEQGHSFPNLFDAISGRKSPFQIDANFGGTSGIAEMLLQSQDGDIFILPALPQRWQKGSEQGLAARGGFVVNMTWKNGKIAKLTIHSKIGGNCRIRTYTPLKSLGGFTLNRASGNNPNPYFRVPRIKKPLISTEAHIQELHLRKTYLYDFQTKAGKTYHLEAVGK